jgi:4-carboxymuconolactone decarboxylase
MLPDEAMVYDFITELTTTHVLSDATYARARTHFSEQQIVDLTAVAGTYITVAMLIAMADTRVPDGREPPFKPGEP